MGDTDSKGSEWQCDYYFVTSNDLGSMNRTVLLATGYKSPRIDPLRKINEYFPSKGASGANSAASFHGNSSVVVTQLQFGRSGTVSTACQTDIDLADETETKETQMLREVGCLSGETFCYDGCSTAHATDHA